MPRRCGAATSSCATGSSNSNPADGVQRMLRTTSSDTRRSESSFQGSDEPIQLVVRARLC